ncbi:hypothetical protein CASFOL_024779 [Castilleja foliolosa]|uniref:Uncharacterized protein n=1 Tax=Castilleja foliolosa TaxID=1961234 RepID=A0ABD3CSY4_9LAMI
MSGADEEWVKSAMSDDAMVGELLLRLHHAPPPPLLKRAALPLEWTVRQRRSKPISGNINPKKPAHRGSPTTPLSWSGATSFSGGSDESSRPVAFKLSNTTRSKVINIDSEKTNSKRSRKKKSLAELKTEEKTLLKEKRDLKKEMATLRMQLERQKAANGELKRMKIELQPCLDKKSKSTSIAVSWNGTTLQPATSNACVEEEKYANFVLPDLNMPFDELSCDVIY